MNMSPCYECVHKVNIPGDCHIGCNNPDAAPERKVWPGCGMFPINFDANTVFGCEKASKDPKDKLPEQDDPWIKLARLLR